MLKCFTFFSDRFYKFNNPYDLITKVVVCSNPNLAPDFPAFTYLKNRKSKSN